MIIWWIFLFMLSPFCILLFISVWRSNAWTLFILAEFVVRTSRSSRFFRARILRCRFYWFEKALNNLLKYFLLHLCSKFVGSCIRLMVFLLFLWLIFWYSICRSLKCFFVYYSYYSFVAVSSSSNPSSVLIPRFPWWYIKWRIQYGVIFIHWLISQKGKGYGRLS